MREHFDWANVWEKLAQLSALSMLPDGTQLWRAGQERSLVWIARQLQEEPGILIADEVGLGKTRLAIAVAVCVAACGGRIAVMIPPGLTYQWCEEELRGFLIQLRSLEIDWVPSEVTTQVLRTFRDLFGTTKHSLSYPLADNTQIIFLSHRFGIPLNMGAVKNHDLWALPFKLKLQFVSDGRAMPGAGRLKLPKEQELAVTWLQENASESMKQKLMKLGPVSTNSLKEPEMKILFGNLIGMLVGDFELIIIDEAHKNRKGAVVTLPEHPNSQVQKGKSARSLQSRMTECLENIVLHPGSSSRTAKRIALTATPMEMDAKQWTSVLTRIGLHKSRVDSLEKTVVTFSDAVKQVRSGSRAELEKLEKAANMFQSELRTIVTRRLWRDHPTVQKFAEHADTREVAHPHRKIHQTIIPLESLSSHQRQHLAYTEGLAMASKGLAVGHSLKSAGARHSQGLPLISENVSAPTVATTDVKPEQAIGDAVAEQSQRERQAYWFAHILRLSSAMGRVAEKPEWSLQWHPKVRHAIDLVESLHGEGRKVLIFGEFLKPMHALDRALNIRHYLSQVREGKATLLPLTVKADDPDVTRWLSEMQFTDAQIDSFPADVVAMAARYRHDRKELRDLCNATVVSFFQAMTPEPTTLSEERHQSLVTWLVQQLCVSDQLSSARGREGRELVRSAVELLLLDLKDNDPNDEDADITSDTWQPFNWDAAIREQEKMLERDASGNFEFRISSFSQMMYGDIKSATRRVRQGMFNNQQLNPQILIAQTAVASEGLNLHRACRSVVLFHLDWNPGRIEQQIGRVDRQDSCWMVDFEKWSGEGSAPQIDIHTISLGGTYDAFRTEVVHARAKILRSQLFGEILPLEQLQKLNEDAQEAIGQIKVDFKPM